MGEQGARARLGGSPGIDPQDQGRARPVDLILGEAGTGTGGGQGKGKGGGGVRTGAGCGPAPASASARRRSHGSLHPGTRGRAASCRCVLAASCPLVIVLCRSSVRCRGLRVRARAAGVGWATGAQRGGGWSGKLLRRKPRCGEPAGSQKPRQ